MADEMGVPVAYVAQSLGVSLADVLRALPSDEWTQHTSDGLLTRILVIDPDDVDAGEWDGFEFFITLSPGMTADDLVAEIRRTMGMDRPDTRPRRRSRRRRRRHEPMGDDLVADAKALGIRVRTLARLEAQGHSADDAHRFMRSALVAHPHVSRDEAIQAWYASE